MLIEQKKSSVTFFKVFCPAHQATQTLFYSLPVPVIIKPVMCFHIWIHYTEFIGKMNCKLIKQCISINCKYFQTFIGKFIFIQCEKMIIHYIYQCAGIKPVCRSEYLFCFFCRNMCISKPVNLTMKRNPLLYLFRVLIFFFAFYKIADHISN